MQILSLHPFCMLGAKREQPGTPATQTMAPALPVRRVSAIAPPARRLRRPVPRGGVPSSRGFRGRDFAGASRLVGGHGDREPLRMEAWD
jgi:hypothetical protein